MTKRACSWKAAQASTAVPCPREAGTNPLTHCLRLCMAHGCAGSLRSRCLVGCLGGRGTDCTLTSIQHQAIACVRLAFARALDNLHPWLQVKPAAPRRLSAVREPQEPSTATSLGLPPICAGSLSVCNSVGHLPLAVRMMNRGPSVANFILFSSSLQLEPRILVWRQRGDGVGGARLIRNSPQASVHGECLVSLFSFSLTILHHWKVW